MKYTAAALLAFAASVSAQYTNRTGPFNLLIKGKDNATIDGYLAACHSGAAIEALCYSATQPSTISGGFYFNSSETASSDASGILSWYLTFNGQNGTDQVPEPLSLAYQPSSNVAPAQFWPSTTQYQLVSFDSTDKLVISGFLDDSNNGWGTRPNTTVKTYNNWALCWSYVGSGYYYQALAWIVGDLPAHNPTCVPADVTRKFI